MSQTDVATVPIKKEVVSHLVRSHIAQLDPYKPIFPLDILSEQLGRPVSEIIKLDANENPYGPSPLVVAALGSLGNDAAIYPDPEYRRLRMQLEDYAGVDKDHILVGSGADELIDLIVRLFVDPADAVVSCPPTFGMYAVDANLAGANLVEVPRLDDFSIDVATIEAAIQSHKPKLLFLCSPNNPSGNLLPEADLERLLALPVIIVLDEAYHEFTGLPGAAQRVPLHDNLIVLRTFSKWAGLAGLRIGYGFFPLWIATNMWKIKQPYNVNVAADVAARASLDDLTTMRRRIATIVGGRAALADNLEQLRWLEVFPSAANFLLVRVKGLEASAVQKQLAEEYGILVRHYDKPGLADCLRISTGTAEQNSALVTALNAIGGAA